MGLKAVDQKDRALERKYPEAYCHTVKLKVYIYPKLWVVLPVFQMSSVFGYNTLLATLYYDSYGNHYYELNIPAAFKLF